MKVMPKLISRQTALRLGLRHCFTAEHAVMGISLNASPQQLTAQSVHASEQQTTILETRKRWPLGLVSDTGKTQKRY